MKEHEKLIAFLLLLLAIIGLVVLSATFDRAATSDIVAQGKLRIIDSTISGLLAIAGMAAQALFRIGQGDKLPVEVQNTAGNPVPTTDSPAPTETSEEGGAAWTR